MLDLPLAGLIVVVVASFGICVLATSLAMESAALFVPAFLLFFPAVVPGFPMLSGNEAIGLTLIIMFFGQTSTLVGYWYRRQIDFTRARSILVLTVPLAVVGRIVGFRVPETLLLWVFVAIILGLAVSIYWVHFTRWQIPWSSNTPTNPNPERTRFRSVDRLAFATGGVVAGMVGFAIGEISNTTLHVRNGLSIERATGTSTLVLYLTLVAANVTNLFVLYAGPGGLGSGVSIPWTVGVIVAPVVVAGGQVGAWLNHRLPSTAVVTLLCGAYIVVGGVTLVRLVI